MTPLTKKNDDIYLAPGSVSGRDDSLDFVKAVAIILMVWGHAATDYHGLSWFKNWYNLFHMPVFFFVAGWCWKPMFETSWSDLINFAKKKAIRLWWPFAFWTCVFVLLHNVFICCNLRNDSLCIVAGWPTAYNGLFIGLVYTVVGVAILLALWKSYSYLKGKIMECRHA